MAQSSPLARHLNHVGRPWGERRPQFPQGRGDSLISGPEQLVKIDTRPRKRNAPRPAWKVEKGFLQWLRGRPCMLVSAQCEGRIEAAHTPDPASKGMGTKAADFNAIPLCQAHHQMHTLKGWSAIGLTRETAAKAAAEYWRRWTGDKGELA